jgi:hypothetical protein
MGRLRAILLMIAAILLLPAHGDAQVPWSRTKVLDFLNREGILQTYDGRLENESVAMPKKLQEALLYAFPKHRFMHVRLETSMRSTASTIVDFSLFGKIDGGEPEGFFSSTYRIASESFKDLLSAYQAKDKEDALNRVLILGELIAYLDDDRVGRVSWNGTTINAEVISTFQPYLILKVHVDTRLKFGRVHFIDVKKRQEAWIYKRRGAS